MKKSIFMLGMALTASLISCTDDDLGNGIVKNPVQTGDEILFGSTLSGDANVVEKTGQTRTVYGDRTSTGVPVYWEADGSDTIAIFCLQASQPADHLVNYKVTPDSKDQATAATVAKVNTAEAGLQWGDRDTEHRFYAFYPASAVEGSSEENETGMITASIPVTQQVQEWRKGTFSRPNTPFDGKTCYFGLPNMDYAYMYAYNAVTPSQVQDGSLINLHFKNLVTVLDITVQGPEGEGSSVIVTNINVDAIGDDPDVILTGDFTCNIRAARDEDDGADKVTATCTPVPSDEVRNRISIPCYAKNQENEVNKGFIELKSGELLNVKAYIIPQDEKKTVTKQTLRITVSTLNGAANVKTLSTDDVKPHMINRVILPKLKPGGTNYWMNNLDPNIYASELSIPGSKVSFATNTVYDQLYYQTQSIQKQFEDGIRAFIVPAQEDRDGNFITGYNYWLNSVVEIKDNRTEVKTIETVEQTLETISQCLKNAQAAGKDKEFAFVQLTWCGGGYLGSSASSWLTHTANYIQELSEKTVNGVQNPYNIYTKEITAETTLGDLAGSIVIKVNTNPDSNMGELSINRNAPMLFSAWTDAAPDAQKPLYWGTNNSSKKTNMIWFSQELTACGSTEGSWEDKKKYVNDVFDKSIELYNNNIQGTWLMNDLGGYNTAYSGQNRVIELTKTLNPLAVDKLQDRPVNAGLGLIFMNYADKQAGSGKEYQSDWLIQTIIDNNFKFALRKRPSSGGTTTYNATYTKGGNAIGWDE